MLISDEPDDETICREGLYVVLSELATTTGNYECSAVHPNYVWPRNGRKRQSSVRSDGDHGRQPGLRPAELNTNFTEVLPEVTSTTGRLGHLSKTGITYLSKAGYIPKLSFSDYQLCEHCQYGKQVVAPHPTSVPRESSPLNLVHSDICGPMPH
jgi:hypothetical protein